MAFRIEKRIGAALMLWAAAAWAQTLTFEVRHGTLQIDSDSVRFKDAKHSRVWKFEEIQQLTLSRQTLRILTYEDRKWQLGRDREFVVDGLPAGLTEQVYPAFQRALGQRFIAALAEPGGHALWQAGAKLKLRWGGPEGTLLVADDRIVFDSPAAGESRTWLFADIDNIASSGPYDLAIVTLERSGTWHAGPTEFRFQLKAAMEEGRYNDLWRRIYEKKLVGRTPRSAPRSAAGPLAGLR